VHAFVAAILQRVARLDALDGDAEPEPPDGELGEVEETVRAGEGDTVIGPDRLRQAAFLKAVTARSSRVDSSASQSRR
jgi:hypothetical protein